MSAVFRPCRRASGRFLRLCLRVGSLSAGKVVHGCVVLILMAGFLRVGCIWLLVRSVREDGSSVVARLLSASRGVGVGSELELC